jgi:carnitine-CoA ligase
MQQPPPPAQAEDAARAGRLAPLDVLRLYPPHDATLMGALESRIRVDPERAFLLYRSRCWSRREFRDAVLRLSRALAARGIRAGDRIGVMARNHEGHVLLLFAAARLGAILAPINPELGVAEATHMLSKAEPRVVAVSPECLETAR